jgi:hypothetical protein
MGGWLSMCSLHRAPSHQASGAPLPPPLRFGAPGNFSLKRLAHAGLAGQLAQLRLEVALDRLA